MTEAERPTSGGTPAADWREQGKPDPHGDRYDCERAQLLLGKFTDDELANGVFMYGDQQAPIADILARKAFTTGTWLTAAKDRIRWLSRALERDKADAERFRWLLAAEPLLLAGIAYRVIAACSFSDPVEAIDAARAAPVPPAMPDDLAHLRENEPKLTCLICGRNSYGGEYAGGLCSMKQPNGSRCEGRLR